MPRSLVVDPAFQWADTAPVRRRYSDTVIYEMHVKGFTMRHPGVPEELRGTYAGLAHESVTRLPDRPGRDRRSSCCRCTRACPSHSCPRVG